MLHLKPQQWVQLQRPKHTHTHTHTHLCPAHLIRETLCMPASLMAGVCLPPLAQASAKGQSNAMLSKHSQPSHWEKLTPANRLQADVEDLAATNLISASRCQRLLAKAADAGVSELRGAKRPKTNFKNAARNLKNKKLKKTFWPDVYVFRALYGTADKPKQSQKTLQCGCPWSC